MATRLIRFQPLAGISCVAQVLVGLVSTPEIFNKTLSPSLGIGNLADQVNTAYYRSGSLAATSETLDLTALTDPITGAAVSFTRLVYLLLLNNSRTDGQSILLGGAAANGIVLGATAADRVQCLPGTTASGPGVLELGGWNTSGFPVSGTAKNLKIDAQSATLSYDLFLVGS